MEKTDYQLKFDKAFDGFMENVEKVFDEYWTSMGFTRILKPTFEIAEGRRYIKVVRVDNQRSVHLFVDKTNGNILKAASWKSPAKGARGNIFNEDNGFGALTPHGAKYK